MWQFLVLHRLHLVDSIPSMEWTSMSIFDNQIRKDTDLYRLYNTNIHEKIAEKRRKEGLE